MNTRLNDSRISAVTQKVINAAKDTLVERLKKVILFGSYARGDFYNESDVDIFVFADVPYEETNRWSNSIRQSLTKHNRSDYDDYYVVAKEDVIKQISNAKAFMAVTPAYIDKFVEETGK